MMRNPVMFVVEVGSVITTVLLLKGACGTSAGLQFQSANHSVALVHSAVRELCRSHGGRPRQGAGRHAAKGKVRNRRESAFSQMGAQRPCRDRSCGLATWSSCLPENSFPGDGEVIDGVASVDESAITGESAPVIRESGGDRSAVTGGTRVLSDQIKVRITSNPGETFLDRMIALVEGAERQKTPNEIALNILLAGLTIVFLAGRGDACSRLRSIPARRKLSLCWCRCWCASSRRLLAACSPRSALPAWTGLCSTTCWPCRAAPSKRQAM